MRRTRSRAGARYCGRATAPAPTRARAAATWTTIPTTPPSSRVPRPRACRRPAALVAAAASRRRRRRRRPARSAVAPSPSVPPCRDGRLPARCSRRPRSVLPRAQARRRGGTVIDGLTDACHRMSRDGDDRSACSRRGPSVVIARLSTGSSSAASPARPSGACRTATRRPLARLPLLLTTQRRYDLVLLVHRGDLRGADDDSPGAHLWRRPDLSSAARRGWPPFKAMVRRQSRRVHRRLLRRQDGWTVGYEICGAAAAVALSTADAAPPAPPSFPPLPERARSVARRLSAPTTLASS